MAGDDMVTRNPRNALELFVRVMHFSRTNDIPFRFRGGEVAIYNMDGYLTLELEVCLDTTYGIQYDVDVIDTYEGTCDGYITCNVCLDTENRLIRAYGSGESENHKWEDDMCISYDAPPQELFLMIKDMFGSLADLLEEMESETRYEEDNDPWH